ncbi:FAD-dependent monooxygenase [Pararhodobacter sp.]|uniref:FAD-dependent monooxygenase n=1 Tax=Pararhodobacter sp. TaxID=2127056 RepID=UPI002AFEE26A|nr:FAD-dependent monooxygenase [Pararhodobacter sp.]
MGVLKIGVCGGGIGGFSAAIALRKSGHDVQVFERAPAFNRVGADINLTPNAVFALDQLGVGEYLRKTAARPTFRISRDGVTGEETSRLPMSTAAEEKYGAPQLTIHRADLLKALQGQLPENCVHPGMSAKSVELTDDGATIIFDDGSRQEFDVVIGADGIHSAVRTALFGKDDPKFTGIVSYRSVFPRSKAAGLSDTDAFTKWWGEVPEKQIVTFPLTLGEEIFVFATTPQQGWTEEGWTLPGDVEELRAEYSNFHPDARALLEACDEVTKSALHVREPMDTWSKGRATILGDAAHPMVPFMAQGACMAIEDAVVLARALDGVTPDGVEAAFARYEAARKPRTAQVQANSLANDWLKKGGNADWVYGYDAWSVALG